MTYHPLGDFDASDEVARELTSLLVLGDTEDAVRYVADLDGTEARTALVSMGIQFSCLLTVLAVELDQTPDTVWTALALAQARNCTDDDT